MNYFTDHALRSIKMRYRQLVMLLVLLVVPGFVFSQANPPEVGIDEKLVSEKLEHSECVYVAKKK